MVDDDDLPDADADVPDDSDIKQVPVMFDLSVRLSCIAHTLQLVVHALYKCSSYFLLLLLRPFILRNKHRVQCQCEAESEA